MTDIDESINNCEIGGLWTLCLVGLLCGGKKCTAVVLKVCIVAMWIVTCLWDSLHTYLQTGTSVSGFDPFPWWSSPWPNGGDRLHPVDSHSAFSDEIYKDTNNTSG